MEINENLNIDPYVVPYINDYLGINKASNQTDIQAGQEVNPSNTVEYIPVVYGYRQIVGIRLFTYTDNVGQLYAAYALSEGYCRGIERVFVNDIAVEIDYTQLYHRNVVSVSSGSFSGILSLEFFDGRGTAHRNTVTGAGASQILAGAVPSQSLNYANLCYIVVKYTWPQNNRPSPYGNDVPVLKVNMHGRIMPEFTGSTANNYTTNPADIVWDILQHPIYGKNITKANIDATSFTTVKNYCDIDITRQGFTYDTHTVNWIMDTGRSTFENLQILLETYNMTLNYIQGRWVLAIEGLATASPVTFNESNIIGQIDIHYPSIQERYNRVYVSYQDKDYNFAVRTQSYPADGDDTLLTADSNIILENRISCNLVTDAFHANDLAQMMLRKSRGQLIYRFTATKIALQCLVGDTCYINTVYPYVGNQAAKIINLTLKPDMTVELECALYSTGFYPATFSNIVKYRATTPQPISGIIGTITTPTTSPIFPPEPTTQPTYTLTCNASTFNEGNQAVFTFTASGAPNGTSYNWELLPLTGTLTTADVSGGSLTGSFTVTSSRATKTFNLANDVTLEGTEQFRFAVRNTTNTQTLATYTITVNDTSAPSRYAISLPTYATYLDGQSQNDFAIQGNPNVNNTTIPAIRDIILAAFSNANTNYQLRFVLLYRIDFVLFDLRRDIYRDYEIAYFTWDVVSHGYNFYSGLYNSLAQDSYDRNMQYRWFQWNPNVQTSQYREYALERLGPNSNQYTDSINGVAAGLGAPGGAPTFNRTSRLTNTPPTSIYEYRADSIYIPLGERPNNYSEFSSHPYVQGGSGWYTVRTMVGNVLSYPASVIKLKFWAKKQDGSYVLVGTKNLNVAIGDDYITKTLESGSQANYRAIYGSNFPG